MQIFLSYASEDRELADQTHLALTGAGHLVFFDRESLPPGGDYHERIRAAVQRSEIFVFLITENSVAHGSYALTELKYARGKWPHPMGRILPVRAGSVAWKLIPPYLKAVTVLEPEGNIPAEVLVAVQDLEKLVGFQQRSQAESRISPTQKDSSANSERAHKITVPVLVAVIGMGGAIGAAAISNWDRLFPKYSAPSAEPAGSPKAAEGAKLSREELISSLRKTVVHIRIEGQELEGGLWTRESSGFFVSRDGKLVTVAHVFFSSSGAASSKPPGMEEIFVRIARDSNGPWVPAHILNLERDHDLALLQVASSVEDRPVSFSVNAPQPGGEVVLVGFPPAMDATIVEGIVSNSEPTRIVLSAVTGPGFAGAPVADTTGSILGIVVGGTVSGRTIVLPANLVSGFVKPYL